MITPQIKEKLLQLYKSAKKIEIVGHGTGWVDLAAFGWVVNKAHIDYKGANGTGKLGVFLRNSGMFEVITIGNKFIRLINVDAKNESGEILVKSPDSDCNPKDKQEDNSEDNSKDKQEDNSEDKQEDKQEDNPEDKQEDKPVKQLTIFEEESDAEEPELTLAHCEHPNKCLIDDEKRELFQHLKEAKQEDWNTFSKPDYIGIWKSIIEKYPETAHFIYELIQNADDAQATEAAILLCKDKLIFKHNGKRQFSLTDPKNHSEHMGDINSITSVACSTKKDEEQTIGKFGVGFKSVFQYTESPAIYDDTFWFRIENYIIPNLLDSDHELRQSGETLFEIPFKNPQKAYREISDRLRNLKMPVLFLPHVERIIWKIEGEDQVYEYNKKTLQSNQRNGISYKLCRVNDYNNKYFIYLFNRDCCTSQGNYNISVGYFISQDGSLKIDVTPKIYCFFPTSESFEGCFVSHAPFLLTDNRDSIKSFEEINNEFLKGISQLAADAIVCLKEIGQNRNKRLLEDFSLRQSSTTLKPLINDNIFHLLNIDSTEDRNTYLKECYSNVIKNNKIILNRSMKYVSCTSTLLTTAELESLINSIQIHNLYENDEFDFIYVKTYRGDLRNVSELLGLETFDNVSLAVKLNASFMAKQTKEWINRLLIYIRENARTLWVLKDTSDREIKKKCSWEPCRDSWESLKFRFAPIAKTTHNEWISPYTLYKEKANLVLPFNGIENVDQDTFGKILDSELYRENKEFFDQLGLRKPTINDYIKEVILPHYDIYNSDKEVEKQDFVTITKYLCNKNLSSDMKNSLSSSWRVMGINSKGERKLCKIKNLYLRNDKLIAFVGESSEYYCYDSEYYSNILKVVTDDDVVKLLKVLGLKITPDIVETAICCTTSYSTYSYSFSNMHIKIKDDLPNYIYMALKELPSLSDSKDAYLTDYDLDGYNIDNISKEWSFLLWDILSDFDARDYYSAQICYYVWKGKTEKYKSLDSSILIHLKTDSWIALREDFFCKPSDITRDQFHTLGYGSNNWEQYLDFCTDDYNSILNKDERNRAEELKRQKEAEEAERNELIEKATEKGINVNEILKAALAEKESSTEADESLITSENREAIHTILSRLSNEEINVFAKKLENNEIIDNNYKKLGAVIPESIANNLESLETITDTVGEENLPMVAEHVNEFMNWILDEEHAPSMVRRTIGYIGRAIYQKYLEDADIEFEKISNHLSDCDFILENGTKYVRVICTLKSIADSKFPVGLSASQNAFLRSKKDTQIRIVRISLNDISVVPQYERIVDLFGKDSSPYLNDRLKTACDELAENYWNGAEIEEFDDVSPEYLIKLERKN